MELLNVVPVIAVACHSVVSKLYPVLESQFLTHLMANRDESVIEAVQFILVVLIPAALCLPCSKSDLIISIVLERRDLSDGIHLAAERYLSAREELLIFHDKIVLFLKKRNNGNIKTLELYLCIKEYDFSEFSFQLIAEFRFHEFLCPLIEVFLEFRICLIPEQHFVFIKLVSCIYRMAYLRHCRDGHYMTRKSILADERVSGFIICISLFEFLRKAYHLIFYFPHIRS